MWRGVNVTFSDVLFCTDFCIIIIQFYATLRLTGCDSVRDLVFNLININKTIIIITYCSGATGTQYTGRHDSLLSIR